MGLILVTGATGHVGGELVRQLASGGHRVRALVRDSSIDAVRFPRGVELWSGDLHKPEALEEPLRDVERVFLLGGFRDMPAVMSALKRSGVQHIVLLTSRSVQGG